jgi:hypothetical protein
MLSRPSDSPALHSAHARTGSVERLDPNSEDATVTLALSLLYGARSEIWTLESDAQPYFGQFTRRSDTRCSGETESFLDKHRFLP